MVTCPRFKMNGRASGDDTNIRNSLRALRWMRLLDIDVESSTFLFSICCRFNISKYFIQRFSV
jgi:hypothetical protein